MISFGLRLKISIRLRGVRHVMAKVKSSEVISGSFLPKVICDQSDFKGIREKQQVYVDKTKAIYESILSSDDQYNFLARPRRFGKSMLCNTIKEAFSGKSDSFEGLYLQKETQWDFKKTKCPVVHLDMSTVAIAPHQSLAVLEHKMNKELMRIGTFMEVTIK
jgi:hypothetical protein